MKEGLILPLILVILLTIGLIFVCGIRAGVNAEHERAQGEAVKVGVAYWAPGPDGQPQFKWKVSQEGEK